MPLPTDGKYAAVAPRLRARRRARAPRPGGRRRRPRRLRVPGVSTGRRRRDDRSAIDVEIDGLGTIGPRYVVAADGMWSPVRKALGVNEPGYLGEWHAFRQYVEQRHRSRRRAALRVVRGRPAAGLRVVVPAPRRTGPTSASVSCATASRRIGDDEGPVGPTSSRARTSSPPSAPASSWRTGTRRGRSPPASTTSRSPCGRTLFVGDAAAATDVMTGEGIGQALLTGRLAAEAILAAGTGDPATARAAYESAVRHHLFADHRCRAVLGRVLRHPLGARGRDPRRRRERGLGSPQLRPVDVRGRAARGRAHTAPVAPPLPRPAGRLPPVTGARLISAGAVPWRSAADPCARAAGRSRRRRRPSRRSRRVEVVRLAGASTIVEDRSSFGGPS